MTPLLPHAPGLLLSFFLLFGGTAFSQAQSTSLKAFNFDEGGYALIGTSRESDRNELREQLGIWYTDDVALLKEFQREWVFTKPGGKWACGYHYQVDLVRNGKSLKSFLINLNCNEIVSDDGYFFFDSEKLAMFKGRLKRPIRLHEQFNDVTEGRAYLDSLRTNPSLLFLPEARWERFEGQFRIDYPCPSDIGNCRGQEEVVADRFRAELEDAYPGEPFDFEHVDDALNEVTFYIECNRSLFDRFDLLSKEQASFWPHSLYYSAYLVAP